MLYISALLFMALGFQQTDALMQIPDVRSMRCINNTNQTIVLFDMHGAQRAIGPRSSISAQFYAGGNLVWMVSTASRPTMYETKLMEKTSNIFFSQMGESIICEPQLGRIDWLLMRTKIATRSALSGITFGLLPCYGTDELTLADQTFSDTCFKYGLTASATTLVAAMLLYKLRN